MIYIIKATTEGHYKDIERLADIIWREHYTTIIGKPQVDYMLDKFQSAKAIKEQVEEGYEYFILNYNKSEAGYISIKEEENSTLFLSKIYVLKSHRGYGIGKKGMAFIEDTALEKHCTSITLTVNKNNVGSIKAYEKMGFVKQAAIVIDIGNGFVMDDFKMIKVIK